MPPPYFEAKKEISQFCFEDGSPLRRPHDQYKETMLMEKELTNVPAARNNPPNTTDARWLNRSQTIPDTGAVQNKQLHGVVRSIKLHRHMTVIQQTSNHRLTVRLLRFSQKFQKVDKQSPDSHWTVNQVTIAFWGEGTVKTKFGSVQQQNYLATRAASKCRKGHSVRKQQVVCQEWMKVLNWIKGSIRLVISTNKLCPDNLFRVYCIIIFSVYTVYRHIRLVMLKISLIE